MLTKLKLVVCHRFLTCYIDRSDEVFYEIPQTLYTYKLLQCFYLFERIKIFFIKLVTGIPLRPVPGAEGYEHHRCARRTYIFMS